MGLGLKSVMAAVVLGGVFGSATATVELIDQNIMMVEFEVEVVGSAESVVAHLTFEEERLVLPLLNRGEGIYGLRTELEPKNYVVVFEAVGENSGRSEPTTMAQMGADFSSDVTETTMTSPDDEGLSQDSMRLLWLAVALGAASLSLLAFWVLGNRDDEEEADSDEEVVDEDERRVGSPHTEEE